MSSLSPAPPPAPHPRLHLSFFSPHYTISSFSSPDIPVIHSSWRQPLGSTGWFSRWGKQQHCIRVGRVTSECFRHRSGIYMFPPPRYTFPSTFQWTKKNTFGNRHEVTGFVFPGALWTSRFLQKLGFSCDAGFYFLFTSRSRRRCTRCWSRGSPAAHGEDHGEAACAPQPTEVHSGAEPPAAHAEPHTTAGGGSKEAGTL